MSHLDSTAFIAAQAARAERFERSAFILATRQRRGSDSVSARRVRDDQIRAYERAAAAIRARQEAK